MRPAFQIPVVSEGPVIGGVRLDPSAVARAKELSARLGHPFRLRLAVEGGGCSGFRYDLSLDRAEPDDAVWAQEDVGEFRVDTVSAPFLEGAVLRFEQSLASSRFVVDNPNAVSGCGCAMSFAV